MQNPILQILNQNNQSSQSSWANSILTQLKGSNNPQAILQSLPQYQQVMQYINQNGGDARTAFYNACSQQGINPNDILNKIR